MVAITYKQFKGSVPRLSKNLLDATTAHIALDCKFEDGAIQSWREPQKIEDMQPEGKLFLIDCCWFDFPKCASVATLGNDCKEIFITGRNEYPEIGIMDEECNVEWHRLGVPCPVYGPEVEVQEQTELNEDTEVRAYAYQYENALGHKGAVSPLSERSIVNIGDKAMISGWEIPDASWGVTKINIYKAVSGIDQGTNPVNLFNTVLMYVGTVDITDTFYIDDLTPSQLFTAVEEDIVLPPPEGLQGMLALESMNILAGYLGNKVYFTVNNSPHNWRIEMSLDDNVMAIAESNGLLYVMTDGRPYVISAAVDCQSAECRAVVKHKMPYPMITSGNDRVAVMPTGVAYPTREGLVMLTDKNAPFVLTESLYSAEGWRKLLPETIRPVVYRGQLFVWGVGGSFVIKTPGVKSDWDFDFHSSLSDKDVVNSFVSRNGYLYIVKADGVYVWDKGAKKRPYFWKSPESIIGVPISFASVLYQADKGPANIRVLSDDREILNRDIRKNRSVFMLPMWGLGERFQIELRGTAVSRIVSMATSNKELTS